MKVKELDLKECLTTTEYNPSPNRFSENETPVSERTLPLIYTCDNCGNSIHFKTSNFEKHLKSDFTNLKIDDKKLFESYEKEKNKESKEFAFLDFYCHNCNQPTTIVFNGGPSGYWGIFGFKITSVLVIKH